LRSASWTRCSTTTSGLAADLTAAGVACRLIRYDGLVHGFIRYGRFVASVRHAISESADALRAALVDETL
jgi:acetyl esterase